MRLVHAAATDVGLVRAQNEDSYLVGGGVYAVCDGMGGARAGEVASESACRCLMPLVEGGAGEQELVEAVRAGNRSILQQGNQDPELEGMGSTLTVVLREGDGLLIGHVGDSRAYMLREGRLGQLTADHSVVAEMERQGKLAPGEAETHPYRSVLTRAVGTEEHLEVDVSRVALCAGDRLLLCSDGLTGMLNDQDIFQILVDSEDPRAAADTLLQAALAEGGEDNITVVVVDVVDENGEENGEEDARVEFGPAERVASDRAASDGTVEGVASGGNSGFLHPDGPSAGGAGDSGVSGRKRRFNRRSALLIVAAVLVLLLLVSGVFALINSGVYFVGTSGGKVAVYQGMPYSVLGVELYSVDQVGTVDYEGLDGETQQAIDAHDLTTKEEGQRFVRDLVSDR